MMEYPYEIINPEGAVVLRAPENCRYARSTELRLMEAGYTIRLYGRRITKTEIKKGDHKL